MATMNKKSIVCAILALTVLTARAFAAVEVTPASRDEMIKNGEWTELARLYPVGAASGDLYSAFTPEDLASWWDAFNDPVMTRLITAALENNRDLASARASVKEARAALGISRASLLPWLDTTNFWSNSRTPVQAGGSGNTENLYKLGIDASWEIDVFGGTRASVRAQGATLEAQYAALYSTWTSLASEVAVNYISLRTLQMRLRIARENLDLQQNTVDIQQSKTDAGLADSLALKQAQYTMERTAAGIPSIESSIEAALNALAILTGEVPGSLESELSKAAPIPKIAGTEFIGIPANVLRRRPDIRQAERLLAAQLERKKAARADLWPKFYLTGSIGTEAGNWGSLFTGPAKLYSFMPQVNWPIFHAGAIRNNIKVQGAKAEQLLAAYERTVLSAVGEVRNAIAANMKEYERNESLSRGVEAAAAALDVANDKYDNGLVDFTNVINAQSALASLSEEYAISEGQLSTNAVALFKALGGGWRPMEEAERATVEAARAKEAK